MALGTFITDRLILRPMTEQDAGFILELLNDPSFIRNIGDRKVRTLERRITEPILRAESAKERHHLRKQLVASQADQPGQ